MTGFGDLNLKILLFLAVLLAQLSRRLIGEHIVYKGIRPSVVCRPSPLKP